MFDPYHKWLGIPPQDQPPNHYRLLGINLFESDADVIDAAAEKQMTYVRGCANGPHVAQSQKLLNELSAARLCLLDPKKRNVYDQELKAKQTPVETVSDAIENLNEFVIRKPKQKKRASFGRKEQRLAVICIALILPVVVGGVALVMKSESPSSATKGSNSGDANTVAASAPPLAVLPANQKTSGATSSQLDTAPKRDATPGATAASQPNSVSPDAKSAAPGNSSNTEKIDSSSADPLKVALNGLTKIAKDVKWDTSGNLIELDVRGIKLEETQFAAIGNCATLRGLILAETGVTDTTLEKLSGLKEITGLGMWSTVGVTDQGLKHLTGMSKLYFLTVGGDFGVTDAGLVHLTKLESLGWLGLSYTGVTDDGMLTIAKIHTLNQLDISNTSVTDRGLSELEKLKAMKILHLKGTKVTDVGVAQLKAALPECEVIR